MSYFRKDHELHERRLGRNWALFSVLVCLIVIVFGLTIVKVTSGGSLQAYDHAPRPELVEIN
ncbi:hypothetical protein [Parasulfitobacter algicola]|uniref:Cytochrome C oxidase assembly protein n=1 Tax=Parasulfitobacter algicola TaxID=2614809 RepID=A0ABX2IZ63_9RHOB|nr:hypothetical protein [Sulfitobacter algicola]NSX55986.1 hypothetical protein [Sulfitobacter algicola]